MGGRWREIEDVLIDALTAAGFWVMAMFALAFAARLLNLTGGNQLEEVRRQIGFLVPRSTLEIELWILLSVTAGSLRSSYDAMGFTREQIVREFAHIFARFDFDTQEKVEEHFVESLAV